jgi:hypothetical protein
MSSKRKKLYLKDLNPGQIAKIEARMRPRQFSVKGFLGQTEGLREVVERDDATLKKHGITHEQIADRLESLVEQAKQNEGDDLIEGKYKVKSLHYRGVQTCPFYDIGDCGSDNRDIFITKCNTKKPSGIKGMIQRVINPALRETEEIDRIEFPGLIMHLIRDHHFFEGDTPYRLNPEDAIRVLEIKPGVDYSIKIEKESESRFESLWERYWNVIEKIFQKCP